MQHVLKHRAGDLIVYNHAHGYAGFRLGNDTSIRANEVFLIIKAEPNRIVYFSDVGVPRYSYVIMMVSCPTHRHLEGKIYDVVLDDCDGDEYLTLLANVKDRF